MKVSNLIIEHIFLMVSFMLVSCSSIALNNKDESPNYYSHPKLLEIINNKHSMTSALKNLNSKLTVKVIYSGVESKQYKRFVSINLESTPVIVAISSTSPNNLTFYNILSDSNNNSIGLKLFAPNAEIQRDDNMTVEVIRIKQLTSPILRDYLRELGYSNEQKIVQRVSLFNHNNEFMQLTEYILPTIAKFTS